MIGLPKSVAGRFSRAFGIQITLLAAPEPSAIATSRCSTFGCITHTPPFACRLMNISSIAAASESTNVDDAATSASKHPDLHTPRG